MKKLLLLALICVSQCVVAQNLTPAQKDIKLLMEMTGSSQLSTQILDQLLPQYKTAFPDVPEDVWNEFRDELNVDDLMTQIIPVYEKHFTHEEIKQLIDFYKTPLGQKTISVLPSVMQESMMIGQKWGMDAAERVMKKLEERGYTDN